MDAFMNVGFDNMVQVQKIIAVVSPESAPIKRQIQEAKEAGSVIDVTHGRKTRAGYFYRQRLHYIVGNSAGNISRQVESGVK